MDLEELDRQHEEKEKAKEQHQPQRSANCSGEPCGEAEFEDWEDYMQFGFAGFSNRDFYGFRRE